MGTEISYVPMMKKNNASGNVDLILSAIGTLYCLGHNPNFNALYPSVTYPVKRGTQSISPLIGWDHSSEWFVPLYPDYFEPSVPNKVIVDYSNDNDKIYFEHRVNGNVSMSSVGYILMILKYFGEIEGKNYIDMSIELKDVKFHKEVLISRSEKNVFTLNRLDSGEFNILNKKQIIVTGKIFEIEKFQMR